MDKVNNKKIKITWEPLGISVKATLLENENPKLCMSFWQNLPLNGIQDHALISGEYMYGYIPMPELCSLCHYAARTREARSQQKIGRINVSELQHFSIKYGKVTEYLKASPIAQVDYMDLRKLKHVGKSVWKSTFKDKNLIIFSVSKCPNDTIGTETINQMYNQRAKDFVEKTDFECNKIWLTPPKNVIDLFEGRTKHKVGSFNYYFNSIVFVDGLIRSLGIMTLADILRMIDNKKLDIIIIQEIIKNVMPSTVFEFLEYCGFQKLFNCYKIFVDIAPNVDDREDLRRMVLSLVNYVNRFSGWLLHYFPWYLGKKLRRT